MKFAIQRKLDQNIDGKERGFNGKNDAKYGNFVVSSLVNKYGSVFD